MSHYPSGAHTHRGGGGGGAAVLVVLVLVVAAAVARPVLAAAAELVRVLVIVVAVIAGLGAAGLVAFAAVRVHRWRAGGTTRVSLPAPAVLRAVQHGPAARPTRAQVMSSSPGRDAIERPQEIRLHLHGLSAEDVAAIIEQGRQDGPR